MKTQLVAGIAFFALSVISISALNADNHTLASKKPAKVNPKENGIEWLTIEEASKRNQKNPRKIIVDVYTSWCGWCKRMDKVTFGDPKVAEYVNKNFYAVKFNAESPDNVIFKDQVFRFNSNRNANDLAVKWLNGQMGYPTIVYLDEKLETIQAMGGYVGPEDYPNVLEYISSGAYRKSTYEEYLKKIGQSH